MNIIALCCWILFFVSLHFLNYFSSCNLTYISEMRLTNFLNCFILLVFNKLLQSPWSIFSLIHWFETGIFFLPWTSTTTCQVSSDLRKKKCKKEFFKMNNSRENISKLGERFSQVTDIHSSQLLNIFFNHLIIYFTKSVGHLFARPCC